MNIAVGAAQCNVQYWCASCDEVLTCTQLATVQCVVGNVIVSYVLQSFKYTHTHVIVRRLHVGPPYLLACAYTGCPRRNGPNFGRVFLMLNYTDITQNTYIQSWTVTEIMAIEKCWLLWCPRTVSRPWRHIHPLRKPGNEKPLSNIGMQWRWRDNSQLLPASITWKPKANAKVVRVFL